MKKQENNFSILQFYNFLKRIQNPSDPTLFILRCYPTDDLMYAILSHGRKLSVLAPEEFRRRIMEAVEGKKEGLGMREITANSPNKRNKFFSN